MEFKDTIEAASFYQGLGWYPIPLRPGTKECKDSDWKERSYDATDFKTDDNIGIRLVKDGDVRGKKIVGIDLDCEEAVSVAWAFLPKSGFWKRHSKAISQVLYESKFNGPIVYKDADATIVEIRVDHQSMAPPSIHPNGEKLEWGSDSLEAIEIEPKVLKKAVQMIATSALVARYYPTSGSRHDWCLALAGSLKLFGLTEDEVVLIVTEAAKAMGGDGKISDRKTEIRTTFSRADDEPLAGMSKLVEILGDRGKPFVDSLRKFWAEKSPFKTDTKGRIIPGEVSNIRRALELMHIKLWNDEFADVDYAQNGTGRPKRITDDIIIDMWLNIDTKYGFRSPRDLFQDVVSNSAKKTPVHPVKDYLDRLKWDGKKRLDSWLIDYGGAPDNEYTRTVGKLVLLAAVRRIREPGVKFDQMMILESPQGQNKSTMLKTLVPEPDWFSDDLPFGIDAKMVQERTSGKWIIEAAELMNIRKTQIEHLKAFLSRTVDGARKAYARRSEEIRRKFIVIGTTNSVTYLKDPTGNRRFWPIRVKVFSIKDVQDNRDQLWAEAAKREAENESLTLPEKLWRVAGIEQDERRIEDPWEELIDGFIAESHDPKSSQQRIPKEAIWQALRIDAAHRDTPGQERINAIMQSRDFRSITVKEKGRAVYGWGRDLIDGIWRPAGWGRK